VQKAEPLTHTRSPFRLEAHKVCRMCDERQSYKKENFYKYYRQFVLMTVRRLH